MENPCEFLLHNGIVIVDCPRATIITVFAESSVQTEGHLRVSFSDKLKILCWEFNTRLHEELISIDCTTHPQPAANELGLPPAVSQYMQVRSSSLSPRDTHTIKPRNENVSPLAHSPSLLSSPKNQSVPSFPEKMGPNNVLLWTEELTTPISRLFPPLLHPFSVLVRDLR